jgi:hypothetical protein
MNFTYAAYKEMLSLLKENHYEVCNYETYQHSTRCVILRHDVDFSLEAALRFAELEYKNDVKSTYFILLSTSFYNLFHKKASDTIREIKAMGHDIGLHFDEANYSISNKEDLIYYVQKERSIMSQGLEIEIKAVSMHRPSEWVLDADIQFDTMINSYGKEFFNCFKYLSDSRMHWREDVYQIIKSNAYERLHILTHPIWYGTEEGTMREKLKDFIGAQKYNCYDAVRDNIRDLDEVLLKSDI